MSIYIHRVKEHTCFLDAWHLSMYKLEVYSKYINILKQQTGNHYRAQSQVMHTINHYLTTNLLFPFSAVTFLIARCIKMRNMYRWKSSTTIHSVINPLVNLDRLERSWHVSQQGRSGLHHHFVANYQGSNLSKKLRNKLSNHQMQQYTSGSGAFQDVKVSVFCRKVWILTWFVVKNHIIMNTTNKLGFNMANAQEQKKHWKSIITTM